MRVEGYQVPDYDFQVEGVTSMSCDTHKYGYAPKGTSVVLFREAKLRHHMYFCYPDWTGGLYCTPTLAGSRPGASSAGCWASLMHIGESGYRSITKSILVTRDLIADKIRKDIPEIELLVEPEAMILTLSSPIFNIYQIGDLLQKKGWHLNQLQNPEGIHLCLTRLHTGTGVAEAFISDLGTVVKDMKEHKHPEKGGSATIYGMSGTLPDGPVTELLKTYLDVTLGV